MEKYKEKYGVGDVIFNDAPCMFVLVDDKGTDEKEQYQHYMDAGIDTGNILTIHQLWNSSYWN